VDNWHYRLGHPSNDVLDHICNDNADMQYIKTNICDFCHYAKQHGLVFHNSDSITQDSFDLVHVDIWGPFGVTSIRGYRYFLTVVDDHSRHTWIFLMKNKGETRSSIDSFVPYVKTQFNKFIRTVRSDNISEFDYKTLYNSYGILHQTSCVETP